MKESKSEELTKKDIQAVRQSLYPEDRIAFLGSEASAKKDRITLQKYINRYISKQRAIEELCQHNYLDEISEAQFDNECKLLGYRLKPEGWNRKHDVYEEYDEYEDY